MAAGFLRETTGGAPGYIPPTPSRTPTTSCTIDEVLSHSKLDIRTKLMVQLASMIASQALGSIA
jgi:hypothetical protein